MPSSPPRCIGYFSFFPSPRGLTEIPGHRIGLETIDTARSEFDVFFGGGQWKLGDEASLSPRSRADFSEAWAESCWASPFAGAVHVEKRDSESRNFC